MITYPLNNIDYTAEDAELFHCTRTSGIWAEDSFSMSVTGADNNVTIGTGIAWINNEEFSGKVTALKTAKVLDMGIADGVYPRIDVIAIQFNANNNATDIVVKKGTPATKPVRPAIVRSGAVYELYLASVYRPAGATVITASNITDLRMDATVCGLMADSVTKIDMDAIRAQLAGLVEELEEAIQNIEVGEIVPIEKGGTNAQTSAEARQNLNFIGVDPIYFPDEKDTVEEWIEKGTGVAYISDSGYLTDKPNDAGFVLNMVNDGFVNQMFFSQQGHLRTYKRAGSLKGDKWYNSGAWRKILDEQNGVQLEKIWENAKATSDFADQEINAEAIHDYRYFLVRLRQSTGNSANTNVIITRGYATDVQKVVNMTSASSTPSIINRSVLASTDGHFSFGDCNSKKYNTTSPTTDNSFLIPLEIYGIKGVQ